MLPATFAKMHLKIKVCDRQKKQDRSPSKRNRVPDKQPVTVTGRSAIGSGSRAPAHARNSARLPRCHKCHLFPLMVEGARRTLPATRPTSYLVCKALHGMTPSRVPRVEKAGHAPLSIRRAFALSAATPAPPPRGQRGHNTFLPKLGLSTLGAPGAVASVSSAL